MRPEKKAWLGVACRFVMSTDFSRVRTCAAKVGAVSYTHLTLPTICSLVDGAKCPIYDFHGLDPEPEVQVSTMGHLCFVLVFRVSTRRGAG